MHRSLLANLVFVVVINLIIKPLYIFGVEVGVQNVLGADRYGLYFALLNTAYLLQIVNDFGLQIFNNRQVAIDKGQLQQLLPGLGMVKIAFAGVFAILLLLLGSALGYHNAMDLLLLIGANLVLTSFILFLRSGISGLGYYRIDSALSVLDKLLMIFVIGGMLLIVPSDRFSLYYFVLGQTAALFVTAVVAWLLVRHYGNLMLRPVGFSTLTSLARRAFPYALVVFLMTLYTRSDGVMIKALLPDGDFEAGVYAAGYRILDAANMVSFLVAVLLLPMFSKALGQSEKLRVLVDEGVRYMAVLTIPLGVFSVLFHDEIMMLLYTEATGYWGLVFALLMCTVLTTGAMYVFGTLLTAAGRIGTMNRVYAVTVAVNILLNFILIPQYKAAGAAVATFATQLFAAVGITFLALRNMPTGISGGHALKVVSFALLTIGLFWGGDRLLGLSTWYIAIPLMVLGSFCLAWILNLLRPGDVKSLLGK